MAECTCGEKFRDAEDYRDHLPCEGSPEASALRRAEAKVVELQALLKQKEYEASDDLFWEWVEQYQHAFDGMREALKTIRAWDMLNPANGVPDSLADANWLRGLLDRALALSAIRDRED